MTRYKTVADELAALIHAGTLKPGERLPSVREASRSRGLGEMTVVKAYHLLEARGYLVARPRSGYYVHRPQPALPAISRPAPRPTAVARSELIFEVLESIRQPAVVPLGSAFPSPLLFPLKALHASLNRSLRRLDPWRTVADLSPGNPELRRLIALRYALAGIQVDAEDIVITDGAMEALNLCLQAVTRPGDSVLIESPTFYVALQALERLHLRAIELPTDPVSGVDLDALAAALQRHRPAACWLMPSFQNPLGATMPEERKRALVRLLAEHGVPLIEDDVYGELHYSAARQRPAKAFDTAGEVLHCSSFSKCLAPGYRIGWALPGRHLARVQRLKLGTTLSAAVPSQLALADYLGSGHYERHLRTLRKTLQIERDAMSNAVREFFPEGTRVSRPEGGYFLWVELPQGIDTRRLQQQAIAEQISIAPGALFSARDAFASCLRLNYGHPDDRRVNRALRRLGQLAAEQLS
jgi:DNA-binding transcriptional MocR family regulator